MTDATLTFEQAISEMALVSVNARDVRASRLSDAPPIRVQLETGTGFATVDDNLVVEIRQAVRLSGADDAEVGVLEASFVVLYALPEAERVQPGTEVAEQILALGHVAAHPYVRATLAGLAHTIGLPQLTIGLLRFGSSRPDTVTLGDQMYAMDADSDEGPEES